MGKRSESHWGRPNMGGLILLLLFQAAQAQFAKSSYYMDSSNDCHSAGYMLIPKDGVVNVNSGKPDGASSDIRQCTLRFRPEDTRDIIDVQFTHFSMSASDITLHVDLQGGGTHTLTAGSSKPNQLTSDGGMLTISLTRLSFKDGDYSFGIIVRVYKKDDGQLGVDDSPGPVGLVVGLIIGIIAFLVFLAVLGVCCYRRKREQHLAHRHAQKYKGDFANDALTPSDSYGLDNAAQKGVYPTHQDSKADDDYGRYSPRLKQKLLISPGNDFDYRDRSESDSDSKDPYIMKTYDRSPRKTTSMRYEDESPRNASQDNRRPREYDYNESNIDQRQTQPSRSPKLNSHHENPRFGHEREVARETPNRRDDNSDFDSESDASTKERPKKANTSTSWEPETPERTPVKPYPLPPLSYSPKSSARQQNNHRSTEPHQQMASRNMQPYLGSSSSSEMEQPVGKKGDVVGYPDEKSPSFSVSEDKPDTRHTLRPDRTKKKKTPEKTQSSPDFSSLEPVSSSDAKPSKSGKQKSKPDKSSKSDGKTGSKQDTPEYEGRFKKADSARKSKSKPPRLGRSRSTGNALDDTESIGRGSVSSAGGYRAVPSVTADDYEDSDVESNYNPLRKSSSKTSLYASRSSLYGRRRRKNSIGESVYSFAYDDPDYFDRGSVRNRSLSRRHRGFRSLGDLEMELREQSTRSTQTLRETATQTRPRKNSTSSVSGRSKSRDRKNSVSSTTGRPKRAKSESELRRKAREAEEDREVTKRKDKPVPRPKPKPRKSTSTMDDDQDSKKNGGTAAASQKGVPMAVMPAYAPQGYPVVGYPPQMPYIQSTGQPPVMLPYGAVPMHPGTVLVNPGAAVPNPGAGAPTPGATVPGSAASGPPTAPKPSLDKWEMLCRITDAAKHRDAESVTSESVFSHS